MIKKVISLLLIAALPVVPQESSVPERKEPQGEAAGFASRDATVLSMVGWGISLAVGFAALVSLIDNDHAHHD
jgi:hypothetical protein